MEVTPLVPRANGSRWYMMILEHPAGPLALAVLVLILLGCLSNLARYAPDRTLQAGPHTTHQAATAAERLPGFENPRGRNL